MADAKLRRRFRESSAPSIGGGVSLVPASVDVSPAAVTIAALATTQLTATIRNENGETLTVQRAANEEVMSPVAVVWSSATPAKATVNAATGVVTGVAAGSSVITATLGTLTDTCTVTVTA